METFGQALGSLQVLGLTCTMADMLVMILSTGADMANAFLVHLVGEDVAKVIRGIVELSVRASDDDEFAAYYGLVGE